MRASTLSLAIGAAAAAGLGYSLLEARAFTLRHVTVPLLPPGSTPLRVLHVSDIHLLPRQRRKVGWLRRLAELEPDLVISTGDNLASPDAVPAVMEAHEPLLARPGAFVLGSNDYFAPQPKSPTRYLLPAGGKQRLTGPALPTERIVAGFRAAGWLDLTNERGSLEAGGAKVDLRGVDDPHLRRDRYDLVAGPGDPAAVTLGVTHAPYRRVLDAMARDGVSLLLAGHTHGGQLCLPWFGTLVTNCDVPRSQARGLSRWPAGPGRPPAWLHVSAGLGTSPYTPVRFACRPEATLLTLTAP